MQRTAYYMRVIANRANAIKLVEQLNNVRIQNTSWEGELHECFSRIEEAALDGGTHMLLRSGDILLRNDIRDYMISQGFEYDANSIEWCNAEEYDKKRELR